MTDVDRHFDNALEMAETTRRSLTISTFLVVALSALNVGSSV